MTPIRIYILLIAAQLFSCSTHPKPTLFEHGISDGPTPWSYEPSGKANNSFTFAIISDLNGGEREGIFEVAIAQINLLRPEFILSVGDLVDGGTEDISELQKQYNSFDQRAAKATMPIFHVGGNHDLTSTVMRQFWDERYGKKYYHFIYQNVLFLLLDSDDYNEEFRQRINAARMKALYLGDSIDFESTEYFKMPERLTGKIGDEQNAYFEKVIADNPDVRHTFILMHKPVWQREAEEGNLSRIEAALGEHNYTVINGHFHTYSYMIRNNRDYIMLGTTGGGQNASNENSFDHITLVSFTDEGPSIANLRLDGMLDKTGKIPLDGAQYCFQASKCKE